MDLPILDISLNGIIQYVVMTNFHKHKISLDLVMIIRPSPHFPEIPVTLLISVQQANKHLSSKKVRFWISSSPKQAEILDSVSVWLTVKRNLKGCLGDKALVITWRACRTVLSSRPGGEFPGVQLYPLRCVSWEISSLTSCNSLPKEKSVNVK